MQSGGGEKPQWWKPIDLFTMPLERSLRHPAWLLCYCAKNPLPLVFI
jgi:hypothetical protein